MFDLLLQKQTISRVFQRLIVLFLLSLPFNSYSQNYFFDTYSVAEGLAQSTVFDILQDDNDYIWLGTRAGVSRFDGKEFVNYTIEDGITENGVKVLYQDKEKNIWMGHYGGGISIYDGHKFRVFSETGTSFSCDITSINGDSSNNIWITSELNGAVRISKVGATIEVSETEIYKGNKLSDRIFGSYSGADGNFYFITDAFIKIYSPKTNDFKSFDLNGMPTHFQITTMFEDSKLNLWFGTYNGGLYQFVEGNSYKVYDWLRDGLASNWISAISEDRSGNIWVGTWGGGISRISHDVIQTFNPSNGLPDLKIRSLMEDEEGNMLIGTEEHGVSIFKGERFISWTEDNGLANSQVWTIEQDRSGKMWYGTNRGINIYDPYQKNGKFLKFHKLGEDKIRKISEDSKGRIWIWAENQGVFTHNRNNTAFTYEPRLNSYNASLNTTALETDNKGLVWAGTNDGLVSYNYDTKLAEYYTQTSGLAGNDIKSLYFCPEGQLWVGSRGAGLSYMVADSFIHLVLEDNFTATCMVSDKNGMLWVGTEAMGVLVIDPEKKVIIRDLKESDGLLANLINLIEAGDDGLIYIGTNKGLNIYNPELDKIYSYSRKSGFVGIETRPGSVYKDKDGFLWFGTVAGVTRFNPYIENSTGEDPITHIIKFRVNLDERDMVPGMKLNYMENDIIIDYISICLTNSDAVKYQIMLEGADNDWRPITRQTTVTYPALAPKKYTFNVKACNSDGFWNEEPITYTFHIMPPFYKTTWFIILCIIVGTATIVLWVKIRERSLIREKRILEEKVNERTIEVVAQKEELSQKNKDITDSIRYAKRLQLATLPKKIPFNETFVLYKPKDIVSGDFYWFETVGDLEFVAAVDCTGHGVPGAFMSIIGANSLNKIIKEQGILEPASILNHLNEEVIKNLKSSDEESTIYDGMDIALTVFNRKTGEMQYSGAYNPLILIRDNKIIEYEADRYSIGRPLRFGDQKEYTNYSIKIEEGDFFYIFSDGYADQFGGDNGKKFKVKILKELFLSIHKKVASEQKTILDKTIENWRGNIEQVDDILIVGRRL